MNYTALSKINQGIALHFKNDASPAAIWCICFANMMLLHFVPQWCDVCPKMWRSHASLGEAVIIGVAIIICRRQTSFKKRTFVSRQKCVFCCERAIKKIFSPLFIWAWTVVYSFYNKLLFDYKEKSYISTFSLFTITYYFRQKSTRNKWRVKSEKVKSTSFSRNLSIFVNWR